MWFLSYLSRSLCGSICHHQRPHEYYEEYKQRAHDMDIKIEPNKFYGYVYDGIWAIALALHSVDQLVKSRGLRNSLTDFDYHQPVWANMIREALNQTMFLGVTVSLPSPFSHGYHGLHSLTIQSTNRYISHLPSPICP